MFTMDDLKELVNCQGRDAVASAVAKIPEEDVRIALMELVMVHQKSMEIERQLWRKEHARCIALEEALKKTQSPKDGGAG